MTETEKQNGTESKEIDELEWKIIRQIEFYFGDHNLTRDRFMQTAIKENDGWISLETMVKFNRLKKLSSDHDIIITAVNKSPNNLLEISDDKLSIRRKPDNPIPEFNQEWKDGLNAKTVYVKGFPNILSLDDLLEYFQQFGKVESVFMKRKPDKKFKGSVFATFKNKEEADKLLQQEKVMFKEMQLKLESRNDYTKRKQELYQKRQAERERKQKMKNEKNEDVGSTEGDKGKKENKEQEDYKKGCVLHLNGFKENTSREDIKEVFDNFSKIAWVEFSRGDKEAWIRFEKENAAVTSLEKAKEANGGKLQIREADLEAYVLEGEEEAEFWKRVAIAREERRQKGKNQKYQKGKGGYRGRNKGGWAGKKGSIVQFQGKKRKFEEDEDEENANSADVPKVVSGSGNANETEEPPAKFSKIEEAESKSEECADAV